MDEINSKLNVLRIDEENIHEHEKSKLREFNLSDGKRLLLHDEQGYENKFKDGRSFDYLENTNSTNIEFNYDFKIHRDALKNLIEQNAEITSNPMCVYHNHVWWIYSYRILVIGGAEEDGPICTVDLQSVSASSYKKEVPKGGLGSNSPAKQEAPNILQGWLTVKTADGEIFPIPTELRENGMRSVSGWAISVNKLKGLMQGHSTIDLNCRLIISRAYFDPVALLPEPIFAELVSPTATMVLDKVVKGEKTPQWDVVLTCGEGERKDFFVHKSVLSDASPTLKLVMAKRMSWAGCDLLSVSHEDRFIITSMDEENLILILNFIYKRKMILPRYNQFAKVGRFINANFPREVLMGFLVQWQRLIVEDVLKAKKQNENPVLLAARCLRHLTSIYSTPYGAMPVAKRVCVSLMADILQIVDGQGARKSFDEELDLIPGLQTVLTQHIVLAVQKISFFISGVAKQSIY
ncbi:unnamed protein product, partial [Mesorhabditis belari]|uniref:BTB domain-containing protein n=1 Tax=Mesorhabditis belari TaxID=2138241 RepID=A0AAF3J9A0_9BILA